MRSIRRGGLWRRYSLIRSKHQKYCAQKWWAWSWVILYWTLKEESKSVSQGKDTGNKREKGIKGLGEERKARVKIKWKVAKKRGENET